VESLVETAGAFPKFNRIFLADSKEVMQFAEDGCSMNLIWMGFTIENFSRCMDGIGDDDDLGHILLKMIVRLYCQAVESVICHFFLY